MKYTACALYSIFVSVSLGAAHETHSNTVFKMPTDKVGLCELVLTHIGSKNHQLKTSTISSLGDNIRSWASLWPQGAIAHEIARLALNDLSDIQKDLQLFREALEASSEDIQLQKLSIISYPFFLAHIGTDICEFYKKLLDMDHHTRAQHIQLFSLIPRILKEHLEKKLIEIDPQNTRSKEELVETLEDYVEYCALIKTVESARQFLLDDAAYTQLASVRNSSEEITKLMQNISSEYFVVKIGGTCEVYKQLSRIDPQTRTKECAFFDLITTTLTQRNHYMVWCKELNEVIAAFKDYNSVLKPINTALEKFLLNEASVAFKNLSPLFKSIYAEEFIKKEQLASNTLRYGSFMNATHRTEIESRYAFYVELYSTCIVQPLKQAVKDLLVDETCAAFKLLSSEHKAIYAEELLKQLNDLHAKIYMAKEFEHTSYEYQAEIKRQYTFYAALYNPLYLYLVPKYQPPQKKLASQDRSL